MCAMTVLRDSQREEHLEHVAITLPDGSEMPCAFLDDVPLEETFWGEQPEIRKTAGVAGL